MKTTWIHDYFNIFVQWQPKCNDKTFIKIELKNFNDFLTSVRGWLQIQECCSIFKSVWECVSVEFFVCSFSFLIFRLLFLFVRLELFQELNSKSLNYQLAVMNASLSVCDCSDFDCLMCCIFNKIKDTVSFHCGYYV